VRSALAPNHVVMKVLVCWRLIFRMTEDTHAFVFVLIRGISSVHTEPEADFVESVDTSVNVTPEPLLLIAGSG
jgi:hypothetical protein